MKTLVLGIVTIFCSGLFMTATAAPVVAPGGFNPNQVQIHQSGGNTTIIQKSKVTHIKWNKFNIGKDEKTTFQQPSRRSVAVNRINADNGVSEIYGTLKANGRIILINQSGIYFAPGSYVNVGSIIASTSDMSKFDEKKYVFDIPSKIPGAAIVNRGTIQAADYGLVALIGNRVENTGTIIAHAGTVIMGAGNKFTLDFVGDQLLNFSIDEAASNTGTASDIQKSGTVQVSAATAQKVLDHSINTKNVPEASYFAQASNGDLIFSDGKIDVSGKGKGQKGGKVKLLAKNVKVENAVIDASGDAGGGEVLIGGNYQGKGPEFNATTTSVKNTTINASAIKKGDGGKVILWADDHTAFDGTILAKGGKQSGNGGLVETSGKKTLDVGPNAKVDTRSPHGKTGMWLLDPTTITINSLGMNSSVSGPPTITATPTDSGFITDGVLSGYLELSDITVLADTIEFAGGFGGVNITWAALNTLTLTASDIKINADVTITGYNTIFDGPTYFEGFPPAFDLTINGDATFNSSIGTKAGAFSNPALATLTVTGDATLGSNSISILSGTITGGGSGALNVAGALSAGAPNPNTVTLTGDAAGSFDAFDEFTSAYQTLAFTGFSNLLGPSGATIVLPTTDPTPLLFTPAPPLKIAQYNSAFNFRYDQFSTIYYNPAVDFTFSGVTLNPTPPTYPTVTYSSPGISYVWGIDGVNVTFICPTCTTSPFPANPSTTPSDTTSSSGVVLAVETQTSAEAQASAAAESAETNALTTESPTTAASMVNTATQAIDAAFSDTKFSAENPSGGCGGSVATGR